MNLSDQSDETWSFKKWVLTDSVNSSKAGALLRPESRRIICGSVISTWDLHTPKSKAEFKTIGSPRGLWPSHLVVWGPLAQGPLLPLLPGFAAGAQVPHLSPSSLHPHGSSHCPRTEGSQPGRPEFCGARKSPLGLGASFLLNYSPPNTPPTPNMELPQSPFIKKLVNLLLIKRNSMPH